MHIYNTLTRKKEEFKPINPPNVTMYVCGPTVYNYFHIGNGRSFVMADIVHRYLEYKGYNVKYAMNITDVDDKIIKKANEEGVSPNEVAERYTKAFFDDLERLKIKKADIYPRATDHMGDIISMIKTIEDKNSAYNVEGDVFYDVSSFNGYGKLSGKKTDELESGARIEVNRDKKNPLDFSLWKKAKEGEPYWESPWGKGRPGWHIECSAMSTKHLGETIDIHAGGTDLVFPHHENEIAQSEACTGHNFVNYWIHFGFLNIREEKMSKSLGNVFTAREITEKYPAEAVRLFFSQTHYAGPLNFSDELLDSANKGLEKIRNFTDMLGAKSKDASLTEGGDFDADRYVYAFEQAMDDDFNTPKAVAVIFDFIRDFNKYVAEERAGKKDVQTAIGFMKSAAGGVLGIADMSGKVQETPALENDLIELFIELRQESKKEKNYAMADKIRDRLADIGVILQDTKTGTTYKKK